MVASLTSLLCWEHIAFEDMVLRFHIALLLVLALFKVIFSGAMHVIAGESKTVAFVGRPSSVIYLPPPFGIKGVWCVDKGSSVEVGVVFGCDWRWRDAAMWLSLGQALFAL